MHLLLIVGLISVITVKATLAQTVPADSSLQPKALNNAESFFYTSLGKQSPLYNGIEYPGYPNVKGNAGFMDADNFTPGTIYYDGVLYNAVPMMYDIYKDEVVILLFNHFTKLVLIKTRVRSFDFLNHHFLNIKADSIKANNQGLKAGYYDALYDGRLQVLAKRSKSIQITSGQTAPESYFTPANDYFLRKNNVYYTVTGKQSILNILKDKKKELQQYISANKIKFRKDLESAMVKIVSYYDHITN